MFNVRQEFSPEGHFIPLESSILAVIWNLWSGGREWGRWGACVSCEGGGGQTHLHNIFILEPESAAVLARSRCATSALSAALNLFNGL